MATKVPTKSGRGESATKRQAWVEARIAALPPKVADRSAVEDAVADALRVRSQRELADVRLLRVLYRLADERVSQRDIARLVDVSQPEVSRRLKRRELRPVDRGPREVILERAAGELTERQMLAELGDFALTHTRPGMDAALDGAATSGGSAKEVALAYRQGLLTEDEYEQIRLALA